MKDLAVRLAALDADAGAALRVIAYFDGLTENKAGLQAIVRGAAVLAGCPARLDDVSRRVHVRVDPAGNAAPDPTPPNRSWMRTELVADGSATLCLERTGEPGPVEAMILERAAGAARAVLDRTRGRAPSTDPALVELIVDPSAPSDVRRQAAVTLKLGESTRYRAVARPTGPLLLDADAGAGSAVVALGRAGIGPAVAPAELPVSYAAARVALRFAADGTAEDPGPAVVRYEELGGLALLAEMPDSADVPDLRALEHAIAAGPWVLSTLHAFADAASLRGAATALRLHHSTFQDRIAQAEHLLGWPVRDPHGRLRLQLALAIRRLRRHPAS
ncbi:PucR family transcriptional regulator [Paractinoplanes globisporus]|uniref:PucR family transcriptional regulator n=1 Tax=Paractinoplanes globisporus TaxID=113565 RepID=A0ABW6WZ52_9ACTN|nr:helix-turn-helix domain-containing protein [Actinoplanes globisporus]